MENNNSKSNIIVHIILIIGAFAMLLPFLWMIITSLKTLTESTQVPPTFIPKIFNIGNYSDVWNQLPFASFYVNTFLMMLFRIIFSVFFSAMAAYAFARIEFPGKNAFFMIILIQMMIPGQIFIIPQYLIVSKLGLLNSVGALVVPGIVSAFGTFLLRQFFIGIPVELEEAAVLDGCNRWQIFYKIMLPLTKSGLVAIGIFTALFAWKDLMWPLIVNTSIEKMPLASGLASLQGQYATNFPQLMAGSMIAIWPMLILFIIFQKQFIQGIASTGSKN
ncbi:L-arabinose transport system permease protein AraQ [Clostridium pasteurianum DSM 525 = ATCC 6013]|uniref:ABC-type transporter, integral membrane subunit n=1 Tax=Clostridium pasteurianum DSM 525 = ATCC 6013 TaxID=1262449 RepID=A0A0H3J425_CLOPA|nr:carbohydrate ABC transporter permease [Clostridium pasteurianum]AJA46658.1 L-arabinose transport system permease protein AraQ [Clostridium pasteurianum DSM 525 = ATCC 6013]AJA50646.1 L-arabinose transport system permease protein AraQ [Clostridium pasteurianum DSM 525 = ATCC 6013]AOZ74068.1 sugar ABC transporter permease [Clostridium pasteurianum DSM 525 = ATCC 6013]AOZ77865.1 sugar ABC transporter permease [Clostridium pasteurianum]ELP61223.1 ABC transporter permease [Clostridium pasteurian